jgi:hypothetical protein
MKKLLTCLFVLLFVAGGYSAVNMRLVKTYHVDDGTNGTIRVAIQAYSSFGYNIYLFSGQFYVGDNLRDLTPTVIQNDPDYFADGDYTKNTNYDNGFCYFEFISVNDDGTGLKKIAKSTWVTIYTFEYQYASAPGFRTTFEWTSDGSYPLWEVDAWNTVLGEPYIQTGTRASIPADLTDVSLPVQMQRFMGEYAYDAGVKLNWTTQSEVNSAGFHILRSETPDAEIGSWTRVTGAMIPGQGNSSSASEYAFSDANVGWDKTYYYQIHEISTVFGDTSKSYYGPLSVTTKPAPKGFRLSQNYPNPFNPSTQFDYEIRDAVHVKITVFNLLGKEVATLVNEQRPAGVYAVQWDGSDASGRQTASGIYFYRIQAGDRTDIRKMTKMK